MAEEITLISVSNQFIGAFAGGLIGFIFAYIMSFLKNKEKERE